MNYIISAPFCNISDLPPLLKAGASEVYFGIMPPWWEKRFGDSEFISRRQDSNAHLPDTGGFRTINSIAGDSGAKAVLVMNSGYTDEMLPYVEDILSEWEANGGRAVMVSDLGVIMNLLERKSRLEVYLSVMAGIFNHESVAFFRNLNVSRIVLPRELNLREMYTLVENSVEGIEFEAITFFQKCQYIDSFCRFFHFGKNDLVKRNIEEGDLDNAYRLHGCDLEFSCPGAMVTPLRKDEEHNPFCAACRLAEMAENGIRCFKIAGRGYPAEMVRKAVSFTRDVLDNHDQPGYSIPGEYRPVFGAACNSSNCYYR